MPSPDYSALVAQQREFFLSGATRPAAWRKAQLQALKALFTENHDELCDALWKDLRRNVVEADIHRVGVNDVASTTVNGVSRRSPTRAASCITAPRMTRLALPSIFAAHFRA